MFEYRFPSHQLIYGYVETDDDEIDRNPDLHFKDKGSFTLHTTPNETEDRDHADAASVDGSVNAGAGAGEGGVGTGWVVEYCLTSHQLIYGYSGTDDDNDDESSFTSHIT